MEIWKKDESIGFETTSLIFRVHVEEFILCTTFTSILGLIGGRDEGSPSVHTPEHPLRTYVEILVEKISMKMLWIPTYVSTRLYLRGNQYQICIIHYEVHQNSNIGTDTTNLKSFCEKNRETVLPTSIFKYTTS